MKLLKDPAFRRLFFRPTLNSRLQQRRWAKVHDILFNDVRFHATHTTQDRILEKYRDKLSKKAKEEGLDDISTLREVYKAKIEASRTKSNNLLSDKPKKATTIDTSTPTPNNGTQTVSPPPPPPPPSKSPSSDAPIKTLSSFIDVDKTRLLPAKEIEMIWRLRHASSPNSLCAVIPAIPYAHIAHMARKHPQFILPVPREGQGAEIHFLQWTFPATHTATVLFTQLAEYKVRGEYASPHTTLSLHTELLEEKGLVLAQGAVMEGRNMSVEDGRWLLMCLQKFYGAQVGERQERRKLLEQFSNGDANFKIETLLDEAERIG